MFRPAIANVLCQLALFAVVSEAITCQSYAGFAAYNQTKCEDSEACCGEGASCQPNKLCKVEGNAENLLVRGPCAVSPYDSSVCAEICVFNEVEGNTGLRDGVFPRVEVCEDGSYCCRFGNSACCNANVRKYWLDATGKRLSGPPTSTSSASATSATDPGTTTTAASASSTSAGASSTPTVTPEPGNNDMGLKIGLGVGIPLAAITAALATWFFFKRRRSHDNLASADQSPNQTQQYFDSRDGYGKTVPYVSPNQTHETHEMMTRPNDGWDGAPRELPAVEPRELAGSEVRH